MSVQAAAFAVPVLLKATIPIDVSEGHALPYEWAPVPGADGVEVTEARVVLDSAPVQETAQLPVTADGDGLIVTPPSHVDVTSLTLTGLYRWEGTEKVVIGSAADLAGRLAVAVEAEAGDGFGAPAYSVPAVSGQGALPPSLTGASLGYTPQPVLRLPAGVRAHRLRLSLVTGDVPEEFDEQPFGVVAVHGRLLRPPRDLTVTGPDGEEQLNVPGESPGDRRYDLDLLPAAQKLLTDALTAGGSLAGAFTVRGAAGSHVGLDYTGVHGHLTRTVPGVRTTDVAGDPAVPDGFAGLPAEVPGEVRGDLTITYRGLRLLPEPSDAVPARHGGVSGPVITPGGPPVTRSLPPAGLGPHPLALIALIGRAEGDCALTVTLVRPNGEPAAPAAEARPPAATRTGTVWIALPTPVAVGEPLALSVTATRGRFLWAAGPEPLVRLAVADPEPSPAPVLLGDTVLATVGAAGTHLPGHAFPAHAFTGDAAPLSSDLFCRVDLSDVVMRYRR